MNSEGIEVDNSSQLFYIGDIVSTCAHPYLPDQNLNANIIIAGEGSHIPPLMVITEIIKENKDAYDDKTGNQVSYKNTLQCKCIWYSTKSNKFEEAWLSSKFIKIIVKNNDKYSLNSPKPLTGVKPTTPKTGQVVEFKTAEIETRKRKSSLKSDAQSLLQANTKGEIITSLLSYVSPLLQVIEIKKNEIKDGIYDPKYGGQKKFHSEWIVKCKWFVQELNKFSEVYLPLEAIKETKQIDEQRLQLISEIIQKGQFVLDKTKKSIIKPRSIIFNGGKYIINSFDIIRGVEVKMTPEETYEINRNDRISSDQLFEVSEPMFNFVKDLNAQEKDIAAEKTRCINDAFENKCYIQIEYINFKGDFEKRVVSSFSICTPHAHNENIKYLHGFCHLRGDIRAFLFENIHRINTFKDLQWN